MPLFGSSKAFAPPCEPGTTIFKDGFLEKLGGSRGGRKNWKTRYFVLDEVGVWYYSSKSARESHKPLGCMLLEQDQLKFIDDLGFFVSGSDRSIQVKSNSQKEKLGWMEAIYKASEYAKKAREAEAEQKSSAGAWDVTIEEAQTREKEHTTMQRLAQQESEMKRSSIGPIEANTHLLHQLKLLDSQVISGLHCARRMASYLAKTVSLEQTMITETLKITDVENKKTVTLLQNDHVPVYVDAYFRAQDVVRQRMERAQRINALVLQQVCEPLSQWCTHIEPRRVALLDADAKESAEIASLLQKAGASKQKSLKEWKKLTDVYKASQDKELTDKERSSAQSKLGKKAKEVKKSFSKFLDDHDAAMAAQDIYYDMHLPQSCDRLAQWEMDRLVLLRTCMGHFGDLCNQHTSPMQHVLEFMKTAEALSPGAQVHMYTYEPECVCLCAYVCVCECPPCMCIYSFFSIFSRTSCRTRWPAGRASMGSCPTTSPTGCPPGCLVASRSWTLTPGRPRCSYSKKTRTRTTTATASMTARRSTRAMNPLMWARQGVC
jgi:hypothetical protein